VAELADIVFDCRHPSTVARFWAAALDGYIVAPYDDGELERLRSMGIDDVDDDPTVLVQPMSRQGPRLWFQLVPEPKRVKNRVHLDLRTDNVDGELVRLLSIGATASEHQPNPGLIVLHDPEGNEFCLLRQ
jgi:Glyoxalase-like domain